MSFCCFNYGLNTTCLFLIEVWITEGPSVNFVICEALFEIYTWILCLSYLYEKHTSRIQSLYLYFIKIVPFRLRNILFLIHKRAVFRTAAGTAGSYVTGTASYKNGCHNFSYVHRSRIHWKCKYCVIDAVLYADMCYIKGFAPFPFPFYRTDNSRK